MQSSQSQDSLQLSQQPNIISQLQPKEQIKFSTLIKKINQDKMVQERIFLLTSQSIYNIAKRSGLIKSLVSKLITLNAKYAIKRKISFKQLYGITLSNSRENGEFVLHVIDDYDYRYCADSHQKKVLILKKLCQLYSLNNNGKKLPFYFKDEIVLIDYSTRKCDIKNKIDRKPKQDPVFLGEQDFQQYELPDLNYKLQFSLNPENSTVTMKQFKPIFQVEQFLPNYQYYTVSSTNGDIDLKFIQQVLSYDSSIFLKPEFIFSTKSKLQLLTLFMVGGNLSRKLKQSVRISEQLAWFYIAELIIMIEELQEKNIRYPNFCLQNIFISQTGYLKLLAVQKDISSKPKAYKQVYYDILGYPQYVAPEMILVKGYNLMQVNLWKLGVCAHYLLLGSYPYDGATTKQIYHSIMTKKFKPETPDFLHRLLNKDPKNRITLKQLKQHPNLSHIDWKRLKQESLSAPYQPDTSSWKGNLPSIVQFNNNKQGNSPTLK